jgi:rubredoxin
LALVAAAMVLAASLLVGVLGGTASGSETPPENTSLPAVSPGQPYTSQEATALKGSWTGEPTKYSYSWNRCAGKNVCEPISGATAKSYTPVEADLGKALTVSVTATNSAGSTTATSAESATVKQALQWYRCDEENYVYKPEYEDSNCTKKGGTSLFAWVPVSKTGRTFETATKSPSYPYRLIFSLEGVTFEYNCSALKGTGKAVNAEAQAEIKEYKPTLENCVVVKPAEQGCEISGGKISFNTLKAVSPAWPQTLKPQLKLEPSEVVSGSTLAQFELVHCSYAWFNGSQSLVGTLIGNVEESSLITPYSPPSSALQVYAKGKYFNLGMEGGSSLKIEGPVMEAAKLSVSR